MKILYYSPHPTHDIISEVGYATHQREVINALRGLGHTVVPIIMGGTDKDNLSPAGIPAHKNSLKARVKKMIPRFIWTSLKDFQLLQHDKRAAACLEKAIIDYQPDLIYERSEYLQDKGVKIIKKYGIRYFLEVNAPFIEEMNVFEGKSIFHRLAHQKERNKNIASDVIFVVSSVLKKFLIQQYQVSELKIIVQPNCINLKKINLDSLKTERLKKEFNLEGKKVVGFVGSIFPHHGVDILIDAFEKVVKSEPDTNLLIVGDGSILNDLKTRAKNAGLEKKVLFAGNRVHDEVFNFISLMDICVMAKSNWYGSPIKIFEYGAMRKPVIAPNTNPVKDVMENGIQGILVEMNKDEVANAIIQLLNNKQLADVLASNFMNLISTEYIWEKAALKIINAYDSL